MNHTTLKYIQNLNSISKFENCLMYMVGGSVRDKVMNKPCEDLDFTSIDAPRIAKLFANANNFNLIVLDDTPNRETYRVIIIQNFTF